MIDPNHSPRRWRFVDFKDDVLDSNERAMMFRILLLIAVVIVAVVPAAPAFADRDDDDGLRAVPFVFVGAPGDCGPLPGRNIVTSAWLPGMGLPDNGEPNIAANAWCRRLGLLVKKTGRLTGCSVSGGRCKSDQTV